eukprot:gene4241-3065_t
MILQYRDASGLLPSLFVGKKTAFREDDRSHRSDPTDVQHRQGRIPVARAMERPATTYTTGMTSDQLIFSFSSDDECAGVRSTDSSGILLRSALPPAAAQKDRQRGVDGARREASRGSSCSQRRSSGLSTRVSRKNGSKGSGPLKSAPFHFGAWGEGGAQPTVALVVQALVQAFHDDAYMGTCLAAVSVPSGAGSSSDATPALVVEDAKGALQCKIPLSSALLTRDPQRPQYVFVARQGEGSSETDRWTLMFQGQQEVTRFFAAATTTLAASQRLLPFAADPPAGVSAAAVAAHKRGWVTLYESPPPAPAPASDGPKAPVEVSTSTVERGAETLVAYTLWRLERTAAGLLIVGDVVEDVPKESAAAVAVGAGRWIHRLEESLVGMRQGSTKIVCFVSPEASKRHLGPDAPLLVACVTCVDVSPAPPAAAHVDPGTVAARPTEMIQGTCDTSSTEVQATLAALQQQIASLQHSFSQLGGGSAAARPSNESHTLRGSATVIGLEQTVMVRGGSKTPVGCRRSTTSVDPATARLCVRSMKRLCNDIFQDVQQGLGADRELPAEVLQRVVNVVAKSVHRCGEAHLLKWKRRAFGDDDRSPLPSVPRESSRTDWTPLRQNDRNLPYRRQGRWLAGRCSSGSQAGQSFASGMEDGDDESSVFRTPPPRAAVLLGSQDFRGFPTPPPLLLDD